MKTELDVPYRKHVVLRLYRAIGECCLGK